MNSEGFVRKKKRKKRAQVIMSAKRGPPSDDESAHGEQQSKRQRIEKVVSMNRYRRHFDHDTWEDAQSSDGEGAQDSDEDEDYSYSWKIPTQVLSEIPKIFEQREKARLCVYFCFEFNNHPLPLELQHIIANYVKKVEPREIFPFPKQVVTSQLGFSFVVEEFQFKSGEMVTKACLPWKYQGSQSLTWDGALLSNGPIHRTMFTHVCKKDALKVFNGQLSVFLCGEEQDPIQVSPMDSPFSLVATSKNWMEVRKEMGKPNHVLREECWERYIGALVSLFQEKEKNQICSE